MKPYFTSNQGHIFALQVLSFNQTPIVNLAQWIEQIPAYIQQKYFTVNYINYLPQPSFGRAYILGPHYQTADISYDENAPEPKIFIFDPEKMEWKSKLIPIK